MFDTCTESLAEKLESETVDKAALKIAYDDATQQVNNSKKEIKVLEEQVAKLAEKKTEQKKLKMKISRRDGKIVVLSEAFRVKEKALKDCESKLQEFHTDNNIYTREKKIDARDKLPQTEI